MTLKNAAVLREITLDHGDPQPERKNRTRWSSLFTMLKKYLILKDHIKAVTKFPTSVTDLIPSDAEEEKILKLFEYLKYFESVSKSLQASGTERKSLADARALFNELCKHFDRINDPDIDTNLQHLRKNGAIVNNPNFENGIVKIQNGNEDSLTRD